MKKHLAYLLVLLFMIAVTFPKISKAQIFLFQSMTTDPVCYDGSSYLLISGIRITGVKIGTIYSSSSFSFEIIFTYANYFLGQVKSTGNFNAYQPSLYSSSPNVVNKVITSNSSTVPLQTNAEANLALYKNETYNGSAEDLGFEEGVTYTDSASIALFGIDSASLYVNAPCLERSVGTDSIFILPITILHFSAEIKNGAVTLNWITASEQSNTGFWVEKSYDAKNWQQLNWIPSLAKNGNSDTPLSYFSIDHYPKKGENYYRITQVDADGITSHSKIVSVTGDIENNTEVLSVFPNPASNFINIFSNEPGTQVYYAIYDYSGRKVTEGNAMRNNFTLNVSFLKTGNYILQAGNKRIKIVIAR